MSGVTTTRNRRTTELGAAYSSDGRILVQGPKYAERFVIPTTVERLGALAFSECVYLKEVVVPPSLKEMGMNPFWHCGALTSLGRCGARITLKSDEFVIIGEGLYSRSMRRLIHCFASGDTFRVAEGTEEIGGSAFHCFAGDYTDVSKACGEIILPASVKKVDEWAFSDCCLRRLVINGKIDDLYATGPVDDCAFAEVSVPKGLGDYYRERWAFHRESIKERPN